MVDIDAIARAFMDVERRQREMPTRQEALEAQAARRLKEEQELASLGLTKAQAEAYPRSLERVEELHAAQLGNYASLAANRGRETEPQGTVVYDKEGNAYRSIGDKAYPITIAEAQAAAPPPPPDIEALPETGETGSFTRRTEGPGPSSLGTPQDTTASPLGAGRDAAAPGGGATPLGGRQLVGRAPGGSGAGQLKPDYFTDPQTGEQRVRWVPGVPGLVTNAATPAAEQQKTRQMEAALKIVQGGGPEDPLAMATIIKAINEGNEGDPFGRITGYLATIASKLSGGRGQFLGYDLAQVELYQSQSRGMMSILAKSFGESGRLSDQDIERTVQMMPVVGENEQLTKLKIDRIVALIQAIGNLNLPAAPKGSPQALQNEAITRPMVDQALQEIQTQGASMGPGIPTTGKTSTELGGGGVKPMYQRSLSTRKVRVSYDGGVTWKEVQ